MEQLSHFDIKTEGPVTDEQRLVIVNQVNKLYEQTPFKETSFYLNGEYIGGRPNDRG